MIRSLLSRTLTPSQQRRVRVLRSKAKAGFVTRFLSYRPSDLRDAFLSLGLLPGDSVLMHSSFSQHNGFVGRPADVIEILLEVLGECGHLFMFSMPYAGSGLDYMSSGVQFNVARTPSKMGLLTEVFRRRPGVLRSENPLHPVLAAGPRAHAVVESHGDRSYSCGPDTPLDRMLQMNTKILFFDVGLESMTLTHYLEHRFRPKEIDEIYHHEPCISSIIDSEGRTKPVSVFPFSRAVGGRRTYDALEHLLSAGNRLRRRRIGNTRLLLVAMQDVLECAERLVTRDGNFYGRPPGWTPPS